MRSKINDSEITINLRAIVVVPKLRKGQSTGDLSPTCNIDHTDLCGILPNSVHSQTIRQEIGQIVGVVIQVEVPILVDVNRAPEIVPFLSEIIADYRFGLLIDLPLGIYISIGVSDCYSRRVDIGGVRIGPTQGDLIRSWTQLAEIPASNIARIALGRRRIIGISSEQVWLQNACSKTDVKPLLITVVQEQWRAIDPFHRFKFIVVDVPESSDR